MILSLVQRGVATPLACYRIGFGPSARKRKIEKYRKRPPPENREK